MIERSYRGNEVAIIGIACCVPGAIDKEMFWEKLAKGEELIQRYTDEELANMGIGEEIRENENYHGLKTSIEGVDFFDHEFFKYMPREVSAMDPQTRLFHKVVWQGLEDAGINMNKPNQVIGLYAAAGENFMWKNYTSFLNRDEFLDDITRDSLSNKENMAPIISYRLNLKGPAFNVHSACSSSALSTHIAVRNLLMGECKVAVAGGVRISNNYFPGYFYQDGNILAQDGHCRPFDESASGTIPSDGAGVIVLKRLSDALADNNQIYGIIKGSAVNNDGDRKVGFTAPSVDGQADCIKLAQKISKVEASSISYIETHGTATNLGDPVEIAGLVAGYGELAKNVSIGSVKSNIGHCDAAAGVMGIIKTALCLKHRKLVPTANFNKVNPNLNLDKYGIEVGTEFKDWNSPNGVLRAGVNSFGIGGTNAHLILEDLPQLQTERSANHVFPFSAKSNESLDKIKDKIKNLLINYPETNIANVAFTLQEGRTPFQYRYSVSSATREGLVEALAQTTENTKSEEIEQNEAVFMFSGQGTQYFRMGEDLYHANPIFKKWIDNGLSILEDLGLTDVRSVLYTDEKLSEKINETNYTQPLLFIFEYALFKVVEEFDIRPSLMIGHSIGEYVAACVSDVFSFEDALRIVVKRGELMMKSAPGGMISISLPREEVEPLLNDALAIAATNTQGNCVVSGNEQAVEHLSKKLISDGVNFIRLKTSHAFHSPTMDPVLDQFETYLQQFDFRSPKIPFVSNVTGTEISNEQALSAQYWREHLRSEVKFLDGLKHLVSIGATHFIEIGPGKALSSMVFSLETSGSKLGVTSLIRHPKMKVNDSIYFNGAIGRLWEHGFEIDWEKIREVEENMLISVPTYAFIESQYTTNYDLDVLLKRIIGDGRKPAKKENWYNYVTWKRLPGTRITNVAISKNVLFIGDQDILLNVDRAKQVSVRRGKVFNRISDNAYQLDIGNESDWQRLFKILNEKNFVPDTIVLAPSDEMYSEKEAKSAFFSLKQLMINYGEFPVEIFIFSRNAQQIVTDHPLQNAYSLLTGIGIVMTQEFQSVAVRFVDVDPSTRSEALKEIVDYELQTSRKSGSSIGYRHGKCWIKTIENLKLPIKSETVLTDRNIVVIGGMGRSGIGLTEHLANRHKAKVSVIGRKKFEDLSEHQKSVLNQFQSLAYYTSDITKLANVESVFNKIKEKHGPINGILFLTADIRGESHSEIRNLTTDNFEKHYLSKVQGINNIRSVMNESENLEFVWCASSLSSILGGIRYASYASANSYLDSIALDASPFGDKTISISLDGLVFDKGEMYPELISNHDLCKIFDATFQQVEVGNILVSKSDINSEIQKFVVDRTVYKEANDSFDNYQVEDLDPNASTKQQLIDLWQKTFENLAVNEFSNFYELGGNSLVGLRITNMYTKRLGIQFPLDQFLSNATINEQLRLIQNSAKNEFEDIPLAPVREMYPVTDTQQRFWLLSQTEEGDLKYHINSTVRIEGLNIEALNESLKNVVERHEILRTTFHYDSEKGNVFQKVHNSSKFAQVQLFDVSGAENINLAIKNHWSEKIAIPYNLENGPLLRIHVLKLGNELYEIMYSLHHIISDGWSMELLKKELFDSYLAQLKSEPLKLPKLKHQYKDFAEWINNALTEGKYDEAQSFYKQELTDVMPIQFESKGEANANSGGREIVFNLSQEFINGLNRITSANNGTQYVSFVAVVGLILNHLSGAKTFVVGSSFAGRQHASLEYQLGPYLNTLPLKIEVVGEMNFEMYYSKIQSRFNKMIEIQSYPLGNILSDVGATTLFNVLVEYHSNYGFESPKEVNEQADLSEVSIIDKNIQFDLSLELMESRGNSKLLMTYNTSLFTQETIEVLKLRIENILHFLENEMSLKDIDPDRQNLGRNIAMEEEAF